MKAKAVWTFLRTAYRLRWASSGFISKGQTHLVMQQHFYSCKTQLRKIVKGLYSKVLSKRQPHRSGRKSGCKNVGTAGKDSSLMIPCGLGFLPALSSTEQILFIYCIGCLIRPSLHTGRASAATPTFTVSLGQNCLLKKGTELSDAAFLPLSLRQAR